jgi:tetratricopeptide (TPR) repeat protein
MVTSDFFTQGYELPNGWILSDPCTPSTLVSEIELDYPIYPGDGKKFLFYLGHGGYNSWQLEYSSLPYYFSYINLNSISNSSLSLVLSAACWTGAFWNTDDCMAESFLCSNENKGAIGFFGAPIISQFTVMGMPAKYFNSFMENYSYVAGEAIMEIKISNWNDLASYSDDWCKHFNFFGDPAINLKYENSEIQFPDLTLKDLEINLQPYPINFGDIVNIEAEIRNITRINVLADFIVHCYAGIPGEPGTIELGQYTINGIEGNHKKTAYFTWETANFEPDIYDIYIYIDPENSITEEDEVNNINNTSRAVYHFYQNFPFNNNINQNSHVVTFDLYNEYPGEEIIFGRSIVSTGGFQINPFASESIGNTCIANLTNNQNYQIVQTVPNPNPAIVVTGNPSWQYGFEGAYFLPVVFDINNDGMEEIICLVVNSNNSYRLLCVNSDGTFRWEFEQPGDPTAPIFLEPVLGNFNGENNSIILLDGTYGTFMNVKENANGEPIIDYSITIPGFISFNSDPVCSDINKNGESELIIIYTCEGHAETNITVLTNYNSADFVLNHSIILDYNSGINPIISDLDNNGESEIITGELNHGLYIYDIAFNLITFIEESNLYRSELVTGDINNDGNLDIVCQVKIANFFGIKAFDINGNQTFFTPVIGNYKSCWVSDIIDEGKFYFIYDNVDDVYVINIPIAGESTGWPGQRGNLRNTGVYEQPAFYGGNGDTVYWSNTITLSPDVDNIIPGGSTVIIKPGTKIKAHANSSLIVQGALIAQGTENHPIIFTADVNNAPKGYWQGITVPNHSILSMKFCEIKDADIGILFEDYNKVIINNCQLENNLEGMAFFNSKTVIQKIIITENNIGMGCYKNSAPILTDLHHETPFRNGIINNNTGILLSQSTVYLDNGFNDIYNLFSGGYYINIISEPASYIKARYNYWGTTDINQIFENLNPPEYYKILPILTTPQSSYNPVGSDESEMLKTAQEEIENGNYNTAEYTLKSIIQQYPESSEAYVSVSLLFECYSKSNGNWNILENYYLDLNNDTTLNNEFHKLAFGYLNLCKRANGDFSGAITNYESILLNDPTYSDSVFAVIDIGNSYEEAGNYKSSMGQLLYLVPVSRAKHVENTIELLLSLKIDKQKLVTENVDFIITQNNPNPFKDVTSISYFVPFSCDIVFEVYNVVGEKIFTNYDGYRNPGNYSTFIDLSGCSSGIYYCVMKANDKKIGVNKMVLKK